MGKYRGPLTISGSFCDLTLCQDGTARMKSSLTKKKWKTHDRFANSRGSAITFGGASACAGNLVKVLPQEMRNLARSHAHNHIAARLRAEATKTMDGASRFTFEEALAALHHLDLSPPGSDDRHVRIRALGHPLQPRGIHIQGLHEQAAAIRHQQGSAATHPLRFRLHFAFVEFVEVFRYEDDTEWRDASQRRSHPQPPTAWMDAQLCPEEGLAIALKNPNPEKPQVLFVGIEWSHTGPQKRNPAKPTQENPAQRAFNEANPSKPLQPNLLKIAALFRPVATLDLPVPAFMQGTGSRRYRIHPSRTRRRPRLSLSTGLRLRLAFPMLGVTGPEKIVPSCVGLAPELLLRSRTSTRRSQDNPSAKESGTTRRSLDKPATRQPSTVQRSKDNPSSKEPSPTGKNRQAKRKAPHQPSTGKSSTEITAHPPTSDQAPSPPLTAAKPPSTSAVLHQWGRNSSRGSQVSSAHTPQKLHMKPTSEPFQAPEKAPE